MSADWKAGDRAVCVDDSEQNEHFLAHVKSGTVYLVTGVYDAVRPGPKNPSRIGLTLAGLEPGFTADGIFRKFAQERFRKVVPACDRASIHQEEPA